MKAIYEESGEVLDIEVRQGSIWAVSFEGMSKTHPAPNTVHVYESDWGKVTLVPTPPTT